MNRNVGVKYRWLKQTGRDVDKVCLFTDLLLTDDVSGKGRDE
jgi:hypothetical protein